MLVNITEYNRIWLKNISKEALFLSRNKTIQNEPSLLHAKRDFDDVVMLKVLCSGNVEDEKTNITSLSVCVYIVMMLNKNKP